METGQRAPQHRRIRQPQRQTKLEDLADPYKLSVRGNTFTYIVIALALVPENLRQLVSFFKRRLVLGKLSSKSTYAPDSFWQSDGQASPPEVTPPPLR